MASQILATFLFLSVLVGSFSADAQPQQKLRYGNSLPAYAPYALYRFYNSRQFAPMNKRNNAEVVNHILKNFGTLDRLGDVGK